MCPWFSALLRLSRGKMAPGVYEENVKRAISHLSFAFQLYDLQVRGAASLFMNTLRALTVGGRVVWSTVWPSAKVCAW